MHGKLDRALELMRRGLGEEPPTMQSIAEAIGMSPFYFSRLFTATHGMGPLAYLRRLRLEQAAADLLANPGKAIVEVALDAGFESQQTFTRAFRQAYGQPPGRFRKQPTSQEKDMTASNLPAVSLESHIARLPARRLAGIAVTIDASGKANPGQAWAGLEGHLPVSGQIPGTSYGVCFPETASGTHRYMAAVELAADAPAPHGLELIDVAARDYLVARQFMPAAGFGDHLKAGLEQLWSEVLPASGRTAAPEPDFEVYTDDLVAFQTEGWLTHLVPLEAA
nr:helix-turn-helix domain-containing protein [uncultured Devosia sp.]